MSDVASTASDRSMLQWAIMLLSASMFMMVAFETFILLQAGENLVRVRASQEKPVEQGRQLQKKVEDLAGRVALLAQGGNANAQRVVDAMARQGVKLSPPGATPTAAPTGMTPPPQ
jgi:hypothetical protein